MRLSVKNIGKIKEADIVIDGITVIAGENDTGKSTVGKALFSVFNGFHNIGEQIVNEKKQSINNRIETLYFGLKHHYRDDHVLIRELVKQIWNDRKQYEENLQELRDELFRWGKVMDPKSEEAWQQSFVERIAAQIQDVLRVTDEEVCKSVLEKRLKEEFRRQISNIYSQEPGEILLQIRDSTLGAYISDNRVATVIDGINLQAEAVYLDDPFVLEQSSWRYYIGGKLEYDHRAHLCEKLRDVGRKSNAVEEIIVNKKMESIYRQISKVCGGEIVTDEEVGLGYRTKNSERVLDVKNLSTGLKTFAIIKMLLLNGSLEYNGTVILDEPEIHLHPEWQLVFAELIVLLHRDFNMHILINTHSPYFLNAIEVYSEKYDLADKCRYYLAELEGNYSRINDVTDNVEKIYKQLARPLQDLENLRYQDGQNEGM